jgi:hypothetical protein
MKVRGHDLVVNSLAFTNDELPGAYELNYIT